MTPAAQLVVVVVGSSLAASGLLLFMKRVRVAGGLLFLGGGVSVASVGVDRAGHFDAALFGWTLALAVLFPLALTTLSLIHI